MIRLIPREKLQLSGRVLGLLELQHVVLSELTCKLENFLQVGKELAYESNDEAKVSHQEGAALIVQASISVAASFQESPEVKVNAFSVRSTFNLYYSYLGEQRPTKEEIDSFASLSSVHSAWPYFREIVSTMSTRVGYPMLTLPNLVLRPEVAAKELQKTGG